MNHAEFEELLKSKGEKSELKAAKDISADLRDTTKRTHYISQKFFLVKKVLKKAKFKKFCDLKQITFSYSIACRHVKVGELMSSEECRGKFEQIESWDTLHAISVLGPEELEKFMTDKGNDNVHFTKSDVEKYNGKVKSSHENSEMENKWASDNSITYKIDPDRFEDSMENMEKLIKFAKNLKFLIVVPGSVDIIKDAIPRNEYIISCKKEQITTHQKSLNDSVENKKKLPSKKMKIKETEEAKGKRIEKGLKDHDKRINEKTEVILLLEKECEVFSDLERERLADVKAEKEDTSYSGTLESSVYYKKGASLPM